MDTRLERDRMCAALAEFEPVAVTGSAAIPAAVALVVAGSVGRRHVVLTLRTHRLRSHAGQFALPGGRLEPGESAVDAVRREVAEEVGITVHEADVLGRLDDYVTRSGFVITPFVLWAGDAIAVADPTEVATTFDVTIDELDVDPRFVSIAESDRPVIRWPFREYLVHAPTGAIVHQFREVVLARRSTRVAQYEQPTFAWK